LNGLNVHILVTGATGFIGRHLMQLLMNKGHQVSVVVRNPFHTEAMPWLEKARIFTCDLYQPVDHPFEQFGNPDAVIHLAWAGLPHYKEQFHLSENLPANRNFLQAMIEGGLRHLIVSGTCYEYGMQSGCLSEDMTAQPVNSYGQAKNALRKSLQDLQQMHNFTLQWCRLFYMHGEGQNPHSLLAQLDSHIDSGAYAFNMSGGEQLRDYLPVEEVARRLLVLLDHPQCNGIVNVCSENPITVLSLVQQHLSKKKAKINLNIGYYPYPEQEPMAFWGDGRKYRKFCSDEESVHHEHTHLAAH